MYNKEEIKQQRKKEKSENKINSFVTEMKRSKTEISKCKAPKLKDQIFARLIKSKKVKMIFIKIEKP